MVAVSGPPRPAPLHGLAAAAPHSDTAAAAPAAAAPQTRALSPPPQAAVSPEFTKEVKGGAVTPLSAPSSSNGEAPSSKPAESVVASPAATDPVRSPCGALSPSGSHG